MVLKTFNQTTALASSGKITFGLLAALWSASMGISATQETLDIVYKINDRRSYIKARIQAIGLTVVLIFTVSLCLACMFGCDFMAHWAYGFLDGSGIRPAAAVLARVVGWTLAAAFIALSFALTYYWAPDMRARRWHWLTPGAAYRHGHLAPGLARLPRFTSTTSTPIRVTYGSLGAVMILLMWFYITGLMVLVGAEINSEIEASAVEERIASLLLPGKPALSLNIR